VKAVDVKVIDVDSLIPYLTLCQISSYHKDLGDNVGFNINEPDMVYIGCIFKKNGPQAWGITTEFIDTPIQIGGSGVDLKSQLPKEMRKVKPDYDLYNGLVCQVCGSLERSHSKKGHTFKPGNMYYSMGFTTRGCIRKCPFCIVPQKEGKFRKWQHIKEFHDDRFKKVVLLDNNILVNKKWFFETTDFILDHKLEVDITQGMDIRLLDKEIAYRLKLLKFTSHTMFFAWDDPKEIVAVKEGIDILKSVGIDIRQDVQFYVLVGFDTTPDQDVFRCRKLKSWNTSPFVMPYVRNAWTRKIARWANKKQIFWTVDIDEYDGGKKNARKTK
jgi:hypothetical protein